MQTFLKVKIKSLAAEGRIIRKEERKALGSGRWLAKAQKPADEIEPEYERYNRLRHHRVHAVRDEARASLLAYGFLRGRAYSQIEGGNTPAHILAKAATMATRFGGKAPSSLLLWAGRASKVEETAA